MYQIINQLPSDGSLTAAFPPKYADDVFTVPDPQANEFVTFSHQGKSERIPFSF